MDILRIFLKILLIPIFLLFFVIKWLTELFMRFTAGIVGLALILTAASIVYCVINQRWQELIICFVGRNNNRRYVFTCIIPRGGRYTFGKN